MRAKWPSPPLRNKIFSNLFVISERVRLYIHPKNGNLLAGSCAEAFERTVDGEAGAHHWRGFLGWDLVGDRESEVFMGSDVTCIPALRDCAIGIWGTVRI